MSNPKSTARWPRMTDASASARASGEGSSRDVAVGVVRDSSDLTGCWA